MSGSSFGAPTPAPTIGVVIPFYQRSAGLLRRAVESVFAQQLDPAPTIVIVDDSSPCSPEPDLEAFDAEQRSKIVVVRQANAGPGAARNTGLDRLGDEHSLVAFLDSDDVWLPGHLARAVAALEAGHDFFFSNLLDIGEAAGAFELRQLVDYSRHTPIAAAPDCYTFRADLCEAILARCPIETSTVVFRRAAYEGVRFRKQFRRAYEDLMFWFEAAARKRAVAFSAAVGCQYGTGINIYRGIEDGSAAAVHALAALMQFHKAVRRNFELSPGQLAAIREHTVRNREYLAYHVTHGLRRGRFEVVAALRSVLAGDPVAVLGLPFAVAKAAARRALQQSTRDGERQRSG